MSNDLTHDLSIYTPVLKGTMKTKELSKQVRDKVEEKYRSGLGYKKISETLNIPQRPIKSIIKKWKEYGTTTNMPRERHTPISWTSQGAH